eukprot:5972702-Pyramimonas_sp.AAC.1
MQQFFCSQGIAVSELYDRAATCGFRPDFERDNSMFLCTNLFGHGVQLGSLLRADSPGRRAGFCRRSFCSRTPS